MVAIAANGCVKVGRRGRKVRLLPEAVGCHELLSGPLSALNLGGPQRIRFQMSYGGSRQKSLLTIREGDDRASAPRPWLPEEFRLISRPPCSRAWRISARMRPGQASANSAVDGGCGSQEIPGAIGFSAPLGPT
jgi:hypothetical protein